jgi:hypothetical protein
MKTTIAIGLAALALIGCASPAQQAKNEKDFSDAENALSVVQKRATITCTDAAACAKVWRLTKVFVEQNSEMRVRRADDTTVETYLPAHTGQATFRANYVDSGAGATITLEGVCRGMYASSQGGQGAAYWPCFNRITDVQNHFAPFLNEHF